MALEVDELRSRMAKLASLEEAGVAPYPHRYHRTCLASQAVANFDQLSQTQELIHIAGRLMSFRAMGRASFAHLTDSSGRIQVHFREDVLGPDVYQGLKRLDLGDVVGVEGTLFRTRTGEITVEARQVVLLAKALRSPPEKWHGLVDVEKRYRQRYLDLVANPEVRHVFIKRSQIIRAIRAFLDQRGFMEVETPILQPIYGGAAARPFVTHHHALDQDFYLRIAPELYLKRLLVGGLDKVYEIGKDFRNEGISTKHNPEFTMLECYEAYGDYQSVMAMTEELVATVAQEVLGATKLMYKDNEIDVAPPWRRITLREAIQQQAGIDYASLPERDPHLEAARVVVPSVQPDWSRAKIIDELLGTFVEPKLIQPTFVLDYPLDLSPFAKLKQGSSDTVERFEAFVGGMEIANAFTELNDPRDQRERFIQQRKQRALGDELTQEWDEDYLIALEHGMPPAGGLGVGIDRLVMLLTSQPSIREVILFPQLRSK